MNNLIVGREGCSIDLLWEIFIEYGSQLSIGQWEELALLLKIPNGWIEQTKRSILLNTVTLRSVLRQTLEQWQSKEGQEATFTRLLKALKLLQLNELAENLKRNVGSIRENDYVQRPHGLHTHICHNKVCIVISCNVQITIRKLSDTCKTDFLVNEDVTDDIHNSTGRNHIWIIGSQTLEDFISYSNLLMKNAKIKCIVYVTNENIEVVQTKLKGSIIDGIVDILTDTTIWSDLSQRFQADILKRQFNFQGNQITIKTFCQSFGLSLDKIMVGNTLCDFISEKEISFMNEQTLQRPLYYIQRKLVERNIVDTSVLKETCDDIFLFVGIERHKLRRLIPDNSLTSTTQEYLQSSQREHSIKFMTLDLKTDFSIIVSTTVYPVHLFEYTGTHLKWIQSARSIEVLLKHIAVHQNEFTEDKLIQSLCVGSPVVLSDSPGIGKSDILQNITLQLKRNHLEKIVVLFNVSKIRNLLIQNITGKELVIKLLSRTTNLFELSVIENVIQATCPKIEMLIDGFDEIVETDMAQIIRQLKELNAWPSIRIWITTRPHYLEDLETTFQVLGYNIAPLTIDDQVNLLERFWSQRDSLLNVTKLRDFGKECLRAFNNIISNDHTEFLGVPLHCLLLTEEYKKQAYEFALEGNQVQMYGKCLFPKFDTNTLIQLYDKLITKKLEIFKERYISLETNLSFDNVIICHLDLALEELFPFSNAFKFEFDFLASSELLKIGLVEHRKRYATPQFIHQTFADYIIALGLCYILRSPNAERSHKCHFFRLSLEVKATYVFRDNYVFHSGAKEYNGHAFTKRLIVIIFNNLIAKHDYCEFIPPYELSFESTREILEACVVDNCFYLLKCFLLAEEKKNTRNITTLFDFKLLILAVSKSNLDIIMFVFNTLQKNKIRFSHQEKVSILHVAAERGVYSIFEFVTVRENLQLLIEGNQPDMQGLVCACACNTDNKPETVDQRIIILKYVNQISSSLVRQSYSCLLKGERQLRIHKDLLKQIIMLIQKNNAEQ